MRGVEAQGCGIAETARSFAVVRRAERVTRVLNQPQAVFVAQLLHRVEIERVAQRVRHHDRPRLGPDSLAKPLWDGVVGAQLDVDDDGSQPVLDDRVDGGWKPGGHRQHLLTGPQRPLSEPFLILAQLWAGQGAERTKVGARPAVDEDGVSGTHVTGEGALEHRVEPARGQPAVEGRINKCGEVVRVEDLARHWDRRGAGDELGCRELAFCVIANRREDILAILLEPVPQPIGIES